MAREFGGPGYSLWGPIWRPAPGILAALSDPVAFDGSSGGLLGRDWAVIGYTSILATATWARQNRLPWSLRKRSGQASGSQR